MNYQRSRFWSTLCLKKRSLLILNDGFFCLLFKKNVLSGAIRMPVVGSFFSLDGTSKNNDTYAEVVYPYLVYKEVLFLCLHGPCSVLS